jgi:hypothetical protein
MTDTQNTAATGEAAVSGTATTGQMDAPSGTTPTDAAAASGTAATGSSGAMREAAPPSGTPATDAADALRGPSETWAHDVPQTALREAGGSAGAADGGLPPMAGPGESTVARAADVASAAAPGTPSTWPADAAYVAGDPAPAQMGHTAADTSPPTSPGSTAAPHGWSPTTAGPLEADGRLTEPEAVPSPATPLDDALSSDAAPPPVATPGQPRGTTAAAPSLPSAAAPATAAADARSPLPERPWEAADPELARIIASLPPVMAEAAIAQGVLGPAAVPRPAEPPHTVAEPPEPPTRWSPPDLVLAPPSAARPTAPPEAEAMPSAAELIAAGFTWTGPGAPEDVSGAFASGPVIGPAPTTGGAAPGGMVQHAAQDRPVAMEAPSHPEPDTHSGAQGGGAAGGQDLDQLAEEVFGRLRWRLLAERERTMGTGG